MEQTNGSIPDDSKSSKRSDTLNISDSEKPARIFTKWEMINIIFEMATQIIFLVGTHILCNEKQCSLLRMPDLSQLKSLSTIFNVEVFFYKTLFLVFFTTLLLLPIGGEHVTVEKFTYKFKAFNATIIVLITFLLLEIFGVPVSYYIDHHLLHLVITIIIYQILLAIYAYINSYIDTNQKINPREVGTPFLSSFYYGRSTNPRLFDKLDLKFFYVDIMIVYLVVIDVSLMLRGLNLTDRNGVNFGNFNWNSLSSHPTLVTLVIMRVLYLICNAYYESRLLCSYYVQGEGFGYNTTVASAVRYCIMLAQTRYIKDHHVHYPNWQLFSLLSIFLFAYYVFNITNNQKYLLRTNPNGPEAKKMKRIPTSTGKDILCDGWWGIVRQPNITADIILHLSMIRFGYDTLPVLLSMVASIYYLIERARDSQKDCKKYGLAWKQYCDKVKYVLIPYIY